MRAKDNKNVNKTEQRGKEESFLSIEIIFLSLFFFLFYLLYLFFLHFSSLPVFVSVFFFPFWSFYFFLHDQTDTPGFVYGGQISRGYNACGGKNVKRNEEKGEEINKENKIK